MSMAMSMDILVGVVMAETSALTIEIESYMSWMLVCDCVKMCGMVDGLYSRNELYPQTDQIRSESDHFLGVRVCFRY